MEIICRSSDSGTTTRTDVLLSDAHAVGGAPSFQRVTPQELDHFISPQINLSPNDLPSQPPGVNDNPREIPEDNDDSEGLMGHHAKLVVPDVSPEKVITCLEHEHLVELK